MKKIHVSVIVAIYNTAPYLKKCLASIRDQSMQPLEVIMVNDGSTDASVEIAAAFEADNDNFILITQSNHGLSGARNTGIAKAKGQYLCFVDGDDYLESDYLKTLWTCIEAYQGDLAFADYFKVDEEDQILKEEPSGSAYVPGIIDRKSALSKISYVGINHYAIATVVMWNKLIKTQIMKAHPFQEGVLHEDEFMIMPLLLACNTIVWSDQKIYAYRQQNQSIMHDPKKLLERAKVLDAYEERIRLGRSNGLRDLRYQMGTSYMKNLTIQYFRLADEYRESLKKKARQIRIRALKGLFKYPESIGKRQSLHMLLFVLSPNRYRKKYY